MEISYPSRPESELSPEELQELDKLRKVIEKASADGIITRGERDRITATMREDGKVTAEELGLVRTLIQEKVAKGELHLDYFS